MNLGLILSAVAGVVGTVFAAAVVRKLSRKLDRRLIATTLTGLTIGGLAWLYLAHGLLALAGAFLALAGAGAGWVKWRRGSTAHTVTRWGEKSRRRSGVATPLQIARLSSAWAMHRKAAAVRPHLRDATWWQRWRTPTRELGVELCRASGMKVWASCEDVVFICAGPRRGKTALLATPIIDAPGAVVTTSTRTDLLEATQRLREKTGPVYIYNPGGLADLESTITFNPVDGCDNPTVAVERAAAMIPERDGATGDAAAWDAQSRRVFAAYLHAAGLSRGTRDCHDILRWVANPDLAAEEVQLLLQDSPVPSFGPDVEQFVTTNPTTRSSITSGIMPALGWLNSPTAVASTRGGTQFDVAELIRSKGTVYMLGRHEANTAALLAALTDYIARKARELAASPTFEGSNRGRLDPPLRFGLDEAARTSPVPLQDWTGDFGGSGLQLILVFQSHADVIDRYGQFGATRILNNSNVAMYIGGGKDAAGELKFWSALADDRDEVVTTRDGAGKVTSTSTRKAPVLSVGQLASLPKWKAVVYTGEMPVVIGRVVPVWKRHPSVSARRVWALVSRVFSRPAPAHPVTHTLPLPAPAPAPAPAESPTPVGAAPARELTDVAH